MYMHTPALLTTLTGFVALAAANPLAAGANPVAPRVTPAVLLERHHLLAARDSSTSSTATPTTNTETADPKSVECASIYSSFENAGPTLPATLGSWYKTAQTYTLPPASEYDDAVVTGVCQETKTLTPPASLASAWASYTSASHSFNSARASAVHSAASSCGGGYSALIDIEAISDGDSCTASIRALVSAVRSAVDAQTTGAPGNSTTAPAGVSSTTSSGGGPRETGYVAAAAAVVVGVAGVMAAR
ncbi:uncharacterized protein THITE_2116461 [Thermothielavioides terrestris NRRL 8126]|uniref:Infection structure specific protein n=1 Tax=Thermothielavioides terrestris (strain ATCC 38088 / NRRL 8126) TaxID=578455 RepID=G2R631_THETT|nr:uncharacterized protein THITE_2116461 [Thermothielavioides terrestris NRRL 8126]AEO67568.1 hypothetical protein THITE_2116461 [Thermothielavioides terrestris NRRL 8126]